MRAQRPAPFSSLVTSFGARVGGALFGVSLASCLVTDKIEIDARNVPANVRDQRPNTFTRVPPVPDPECTPLGRNTPVQAMRFAARVIDADIEDTLEARLVVNGELATEAQLTIAPSSQADRGFVAACARISRLSRLCNRVELCVSRNFKNEANPYATEDPDDLAKVEWWVLGPASSVAQAEPSDCTELFDGGTP